MKLSKPVKIFIGVITFWSAIYPFLFILMMEADIRFLSPFEDSSSAFTFFSGLFLLHCLTIIFYLGLTIFYIVHAIKNNRASEVVRIVLLVGIFLIPFVVMPFYYILYIWLNNPPAWAMTNDTRPKEPLWRQKRIWILGAGILGAVIICNLGLPSIINYGRSFLADDQPRGEVLQEFEMEQVESKEVEPDQNEYISALAISPDGEIVATGTLKGFIYLWRVSDGSVINISYAHQDGAVWGLVFSHDGETLISSASDKSIKLWRVSDWDLLHTIETRCEAFDLAISPDGDKLAASFDCLSGEGIKIWDLTYGTLLQTLGSQSDGTQSITFSPDGQLLAAGGWRKLQIWRLSDGLLMHNFSGIEESSGDLAVAFSPDGKTLISGGEYDAIRIWNPSDGSLERKIKIEFSGSNPVFFPDGESFMVGLWDGKIKRWNISNGRIIETLNRPSIGVEFLAVSADGTVLASSDARLTRVWAVSP